MTSISAISLALPMLPAAANKVRATTAGNDFCFHLQAQARPRVQPPDITAIQLSTDSAMNLARRPEVEAMLQMLAWRKSSDSSPSRPARSTSVTRAHGLHVENANCSNGEVSTSREASSQYCVTQHIISIHIESADDRALCMYGDEESEVCSDSICEGGLNAFAIAVALSAITLTWIPIEIVRAPLRMPNIRILRRRKVSSAESPLYDQSATDAGEEQTDLDNREMLSDDGPALNPAQR